MKRRSFLRSAAIGWLLAVPLGAAAQRSPSPRQIGYLTPVSEAAAAPLVSSLRDILREQGYDDRALMFDVRAADGDPDRLRRFANELVARKVDVIVAVSPPAIRAASQATRTIPIVMAFWGGPGLVESGTIASLARPGTNVTGVFMLAEENEAKRLEFLLQAVPNARRVGMLNPDLETEARLTELRPVAEAARVELVASTVPTSGEYERVFQEMASKRIDAVLVPTFPRFHVDGAQIIDAAAKHRLPAMYEWGDMARAGGLIAYGPIFMELHRRVARYVDRILKGANPGSLPVEQPTRFELVINLRTAKALGITVPQALLLRADEVIR